MPKGSSVNEVNEEKSDVVVGELKAAREKLDGHYRAFITYLCGRLRTPLN